MVKRVLLRLRISFWLLDRISVVQRVSTLMRRFSFLQLEPFLYQRFPRKWLWLEQESLDWRWLRFTLEWVPKWLWFLTLIKYYQNRMKCSRRNSLRFSRNKTLNFCSIKIAPKDRSIPKERLSLLWLIRLQTKKRPWRLTFVYCLQEEFLILKI